MTMLNPEIIKGSGFQTLVWESNTDLGLVRFLCLMAYQTFLGYVMPKPYF